MRIALDLQAAAGQRTGIGAYARELATALEDIPDIHVIPIIWQQTPTMRLHRRLQWQQWEVPRRARGANLLHATGFDAPMWSPIPTVLTVHDLIGMLFPTNMPPVARFYWQRWLPWSVRFADHVIADSECTRRDIVRLLKVPESRITVVPLGVDERFLPQALDTIAALRQRLGLPERMILYLGTIEPRKGLDTLLDAWASLAAELPDVQLVIGGKAGWYTEQLHEQQRRLGLEQRVRWLGYVDDADVPALYSAAEVFVFPSRYEGFGLPPLEAMACGTPVITSNAASLPEVVGEAGGMVPSDTPDALANMLRVLLNDPALRQRWRERGIERAMHFSWKQTARQTAAVYRSVLKLT